MTRFQGHGIIQRQINRKWYQIDGTRYDGGLIESHTWSSNRAIFNDIERPQT